MKDGKAEKPVVVAEDGGASAVHKLVYVVLKATMGDCDVDKGKNEEASPVMEAATASLRTMSSEVPMVVMQMWLEQFARIHGGSSMAEYASRERALLLRNMEQMIGINF